MASFHTKGYRAVIAGPELAIYLSLERETLYVVLR